MNMNEIANLEDVFKNDYEELTTLLKVWIPRAENDDDAVSAVIRIMQQRQRMLQEYYGIIPDETSTLEQFRKKHEERRNKNTTKFKK